MNNKIRMILAIILQILCSIMSTSVAFFLMEIIDLITENSLNELLHILVLSGIFMVIYFFSEWFSFHVRNAFVKGELIKYRQRMFENVIRKNTKNFYSESIGNYISPLVQDTNIIREDYYTGIFSLVEQVCALLLGIVAVIYLSFPLAVSVLIVSSFPFLLSLYYGKRIIEYQNAVSDANGECVSNLKDMLSGFSTIKAFHAEKTVERTFGGKNEAVEKANQDFRNLTATVNLLSTVLIYIVIMTVFAMGAYLIHKGKATIGTLVAYIQLLNNLIYPASALALTYQKKKAGKLLMKKAEDMMLSNQSKKEDLMKIDRFQYINFDKVSYSYDEKEVLHDITFRVEENQKIAIVGNSGGGKSTILSLIQGLYSGYNGKVCINGTELNDIDLDNWSKYVSIVEQPPFIFDSSIYFNITMGEQFDEEDIQNAVILSGLSSIISKNGKEYQCGEGGKFLSGGEKQRISIARCILQKKQLLLLDESTSSLDSVTAYEIEQNVLNLENITCIVVTHRMDKSVLSQYDSIIVLKDGKIVEQGSFDELYNHKKELFSLLKEY